MVYKNTRVFYAIGTPETVISAHLEDVEGNMRSHKTPRRLSDLNWGLPSCPDCNPNTSHNPFARHCRARWSFPWGNLCRKQNQRTWHTCRLRRCRNQWQLHGSLSCCAVQLTRDRRSVVVVHGCDERLHERHAGQRWVVSGGGAPPTRVAAKIEVPKVREPIERLRGEGCELVVVQIEVPV